MAHGKSFEFKNIKSTKGKVTSSPNYQPKSKDLSKRDKHRLAVKNKPV